MPRFRLTLEYDGTDFVGWQVQSAGARSVQGCLEQALACVTGQRVAVHGAGRTDAGVHAEAQVASVELETRLEPGALARALNGTLPRDVAVIDVARAAPGFHARRDARAKTYRYAFWNGPHPSPLRARRFLHVRGALDLGAMRAAAVALIGSHDFACFRSTGSAVKTTVRTLSAVELRGEAGGEILLHVTGSGFLRHMVRAIAGTLLEVGQGRRAADSLPGLLASRDRARAGPSAPAHGLTLVRVEY